jgi:hypothetical protein
MVTRATEEDITGGVEFLSQPSTMQVVLDSGIALAAPQPIGWEALPSFSESL